MNRVVRGSECDKIMGRMASGCKSACFSLPPNLNKPSLRNGSRLTSVLDLLRGLLADSEQISSE